MERADEHIDIFNQTWEQWVALHPYKYAPEIYANGREHVYRLDDPIPVVDLRIASIIGDAIHNLRSALDHIAITLVLLNEGTVSTRTAYPMHRRKRVKGPMSRKSRRVVNQVYGLDEGRMAQQLLALSHLDNIDKHRHLHVVTAVPHNAVFSVEFLSPGEATKIDMTRTRLYPAVLNQRGKVVAKVVYFEPQDEPDPNFTVKTVLTFAKKGMPKAARGTPVLTFLAPLNFRLRWEAIPMFQTLFAQPRKGTISAPWPALRQ